MTNAESIRTVENMQRLLKSHGFFIKNNIDGVIVIAADNNEHPGYAKDAPIGHFVSAEGVIAFIAGWSRHDEYVRLSGDYVKKKHHPGSNRKKVKTKP